MPVDADVDLVSFSFVVAVVFDNSVPFAFIVVVVVLVVVVAGVVLAVDSVVVVVVVVVVVTFFLMIFSGVCLPLFDTLNASIFLFLGPSLPPLSTESVAADLNTTRWRTAMTKQKMRTRARVWRRIPDTRLVPRFFVFIASAAAARSFDFLGSEGMDT